MKLTKTIGKEILLGSWFLGGGGGGSSRGGRSGSGAGAADRRGGLFRDVAELADDEVIVTASLVGSPASTTSCIKDVHYRQVYDWFCLNRSKDPFPPWSPTSRAATASANGWMLSAITGLPMLDAACNGRAHPTGVMGAMGLNAIPDYRSLQTAGRQRRWPPGDRHHRHRNGGRHLSDGADGSGTGRRLCDRPAQPGNGCSISGKTPRRAWFPRHG